MSGEPFRLRVAERFDAAAASYDAHSAVQRHAARELARLIAAEPLPPRPRVLEIGCGTGHLTRLLTQQSPDARILATDIAPAMVAICRQRLPALAYAIMDGTRPAAAGPFDLVCANLAAQWFPDLAAATAQLARLVAPGGLLALTLLGAGTFSEWQQAHGKLGLRGGTLPFPAPLQARAAFPAAGELRLIAEHHIDHPATALDFLQSLRAIGADTAAAGHAPLSAGQLRRVLRQLGATPAISYELIYALWRAPDPVCLSGEQAVARK
jgi:malonyl-CoA O-methyltransferase